MDSTDVTSFQALPAEDKPVLGILVKHPQAGRVKTRLAAETSPEWASQVAEAFLLDLLDRLAPVNARRILSFTPPESRPYFSNLARGRYALLHQEDGDLGVRMAAFFADQFAEGAEQVILIGADAPTLPLDFILQAFHALERADVVLGPATDGGYYLVGCARRLPPIFQGVAWGTSHVLQDTVSRLGLTGWRLALLPPWYDVDTLDDWRMLQGHLAALRRAGVDPQLPRTELLALAHVSTEPH